MKRKRRRYRKAVAGYPVSRLKFIDESSAQLNLTRRYGWAPSAERVVDSVPENHGRNLTTVAALGLAGVEAPLIFEGAMNGSVFRTYVEQNLAPTLQRGDVVIMDNLPAHKVSGVVDLIQARGAEVLFLPPYSPDLNPIELCWSKVKSALRQVKARTRDALIDALAQALRSVSLTDIVHWFAHRGYCLATT
ncbi:MAG: IS630 family transposase [Nitrososphaera sp.]|nr:IS630 family transposase [Nitrososphaera sp.]